MKIRVIDLMKYYQGDGLKLDSPESIAERRNTRLHEKNSMRTAHRGHRPILIAATLLLVVTASAATPFVLSRTAGHGAMTEGTVPTESVQNELPSELPTAPQEGMPESAAAPQRLIPSYTITGAKVRESYTGADNVRYGQSLLHENNIGYYGNIINMDGTYYTMTDNGPELLETTKLQTTVELYGSWEVDIDYAVVDGRLAFCNNTSTEDYTVVDGKKITRSDYDMANGRFSGSDMEWITPSVAVALPFENSADTVMLRIYRTDIPAVERASYTFFYNVITGEINDPLANVPELFNHDCFSRASFNSSLTRAIVETDKQDGYEYIQTAYVCDLATGEMTAVSELAAPHMPEPENPETTFSLRAEGCMWADDNTLLYFIEEYTPNGQEWTIPEDGGSNDRCYWLCAYDMTTRTVKYQLRDVPLLTSWGAFNQPYLRTAIQIIDTGTGAKYLFDQNMDTSCGDETSTRTIFYCYDKEAYLLDSAQKGWIKLSDYMELPDPNRDNPNEILTTAKFLTDNLLCLMTEDTVYCYRIPDNLPMNQLQISN